MAHAVDDDFAGVRGGVRLVAGGGLLSRRRVDGTPVRADVRVVVVRYVLVAGSYTHLDVYKRQGVDKAVYRVADAKSGKSADARSAESEPNMLDRLLSLLPGSDRNAKDDETKLADSEPVRDGDILRLALIHIFCSHTERPTLSQSVMRVPLYFHAPRSLSVSSHLLNVTGTPSMDS